MPEVSATPGDPVRAYNVPGTSNNGQFFAMGSPKDINTTTTRSSIAAADVPISGTMDPSSVSAVQIRDAAYLWVGGNCSVNSGEISFVVAMFDNSGNLFCVSNGYSLSATDKYASNGRFAATPGVAIDVLGATSVAVIVTAISGSWNLFYKPSY